VLGYAAEALLLAGDVEGAQAQLQEALQIADELGEGVYLPQLLVLQAAIARAEGRPEAAAASARRAIEKAREQQAPWLELLALTELCAHHDASMAERQTLAELMNQLPEAATTEPVLRARSLLQPAKPA
jgi:ATP/maltotriose-dependent transcriptional regulator MalT